MGIMQTDRVLELLKTEVAGIDAIIALGLLIVLASGPAAIYILLKQSRDRRNAKKSRPNQKTPEV
jgi:hypothetical protein